MNYIYKIENKVNNNFYIGSTSSFEERIKSHIYDLKNNRHRNKHIQSAWNKYGEQNFYFSLIDTIKGNRMKGYLLEQWYLDNNDFQNMYNSSRNSIIPYIYCDKMINVYDSKGNRIFKGNTTDASVKFSRTIKQIHRYCKRKTMHVDGLVFRFDNEFSKEHYKEFVERKYLFFLNPLGVILKKYSSIKEASIDTNYSIPVIRGCLNNKTKTNDYCSFIYCCDYEMIEKSENSFEDLMKIGVGNSLIKIGIYDIKGCLIKYVKNIKEVSDYLNVSESSVRGYYNRLKKNNYKHSKFFKNQYILSFNLVDDYIDKIKTDLVFYEVIDTNNTSSFYTVFKHALYSMGIKSYVKNNQKYISYKNYKLIVHNFKQ